jgi:FkbM family methyltransferase
MEGLRRRLFERLERYAQRNLGKGFVQSLHSEARDALRLLGQAPLGVVVDVGANAGDWAAALLDLRQPARLLLVEPSSANASHLRKRFASTPGDVSIAEVAISSDDGEAMLYADAPDSKLASLVQRDLRHVGLSHPQSETVKTVAFQTLCSAHGIEEISILKVDVEGLELTVLTGARPMLPRIHVIQFEFGGTAIDARTYFRDFWYLLSPTHHIYIMTPHGPEEIKNYGERHEVPSISNFLCALRADLVLDVPSIHN